MNKTKIKKILSALAVGLLVSTQMSVFAAPIGTGSVVGDASFDATIVWDDNFPGSATGTVTGILVSATIEPTISMTVSTGAINLGTLVANVTSTGSIDIEVGTNAANGVTITVESGSGGLTNTSNNSLQINDLVADGSAESYEFKSIVNTIDSSIVGFTSTGSSILSEVNDSTPLTIYNTNKPEISDGTDVDVTFTVETTPNAQTAAGTYEDRLNFTIVGNF